MSSHSSPKGLDSSKHNKIKTLKDMDLIMQAETVLTRARDRANIPSRFTSEATLVDSGSPKAVSAEDKHPINSSTPNLGRVSDSFEASPSDENSSRFSIADFDEEVAMYNRYRSTGLRSPVEEHQRIDGRPRGFAEEENGDRLIEFTPKINKPDLMYFTPAPTKVHKGCEEDDTPLAQSTPPLSRLNLIDPGQTPINTRRGHLPTPLRPITRSLEKRGARYTIDDNPSLLTNMDEGTSIPIPTMYTDQSINPDSHNGGEEHGVLNEDEEDSNQEEGKMNHGQKDNLGTNKHPLAFATSSEFHTMCSRGLCCFVAMLIAYLVLQLWDENELPDL